MRSKPRKVTPLRKYLSGLTDLEQAQLADQADCSLGYLFKIAAGGANPAPKLRRRLANATNQEVSESDLCVARKDESQLVDPYV